MTRRHAISSCFEHWTWHAKLDVLARVRSDYVEIATKYTGLRVST